MAELARRGLLLPHRLDEVVSWWPAMCREQGAGGALLLGAWCGLRVGASMEQLCCRVSAWHDLLVGASAGTCSDRQLSQWVGTQALNDPCSKQ